jgi:WD40 repeat protein
MRRLSDASVSMATDDAKLPAWSTGIGEYPSALTFSSDARHLAVSDAGGRIRVYESNTGALMRDWQAHELGVRALHWHPDGSKLLSGGEDGCARLWRCPDTSGSTEILSGRAWVDHVSFSPCGTRLVAAAGKTLTFANADGSQPFASEEHVSSITGVAWRANSEQVLTCCYGGMQSVVAANGHIKRRFKWKGSLLTLALSPDGKVAACGCQDNSVHFWRLSSGADAAMSGYPAKPTALSWRADAQVLAVAGGAEITLWSFAGKGPEGTRPTCVQTAHDLITVLAFAPRGGALASGCRAGHVSVWNPGRSKEPALTLNLSAPIAQIAWGITEERLMLALANASGEIRCLQL